MITTLIVVVGLYISIALAFLRIGQLGITAWKEVELKRLEGETKKEGEQKESDIFKDVEDLKAKMNKLQMEKALKAQR